MPPESGLNSKPSRHRKRKSRTEVSPDISSGCESYFESKKDETKTTKSNLSIKSDSNCMADSDISAAFSEYYLEKVTSEFSNDLDQLRSADDFKDESIPVLINALRQGTSLFSKEDQRRIVVAGLKKD